MMKPLLVAVALASVTPLPPATADAVTPVACPTEDDLFDLLNAIDRHDIKETARLMGPVCRPLAGVRYEVEETANGVTRIRVFSREGDWAGSQLAYTLDEMVMTD